jgi:5-oxoprolinase (ATP-hydrolysing) subunit A
MSHPQPTIDLNCDLGEGYGAWSMGPDEALLEIVTSANVACGFHAGDPTTMRRVCERAAGLGVVIGAHVGYRDLAGFGRRPMTVPAEELADEIVYQIAALDGFARLAGTRVGYVKPHGALYNTVAVDAAQASALAEAAYRYDRGLAVLGLADSAGLDLAAQRELVTVPEAFADRAYTADGRLVPRSVPGAVIHDVDKVIKRCLSMVLTGKVRTIDGKTLRIQPRSLCVHGDTPGAVEIARELRDALLAAGVVPTPFVELEAQDVFRDGVAPFADAREPVLFKDGIKDGAV